MALYSNMTAKRSADFGGHDAHMHSPMREGPRMEIGEEVASKGWKAMCFSVDSITAGKPEALKCLQGWNLFMLLSKPIK